MESKLTWQLLGALVFSSASTACLSGSGDEPDDRGEIVAAVAPATTSGAPAEDDIVPCLARPLSPVGAAMQAVPGVGARLSRCVAWPDKWLYSIDRDPDTFTGFATDVANQFLQTKASFSHSSLYYHPEYGFRDLLVQLHERLGRGGIVLPDDEKPVIRFMFGDYEDEICPDGPCGDEVEVFEHITAGLRKDVAEKPELWNVKVAVSTARWGLANGWNHTKLNIRDGVDVFASSIETPKYELGIHLAGQPAQYAMEWYDVLWSSTRIGECIQSTPWQWVDPGPCYQPAPALVPANDALRRVNVFALRRGYVEVPMQTVIYEADEALFAGMRSTERSIFFLNPGMVPVYHFGSPINGTYSEVLVNVIADQLTRSVDVKFVWGDEDGEHPRSDWTWVMINAQIAERLSERGLSPRQRDIAACMFHVRDFGPVPTLGQQGSHAKFYMLDEGGFYIGSQNMYPTGIMVLPAPLEPEPPELAEFGYYVDARPGINDDLSAEVVTEIVEPTWSNASVVSIGCDALPHPSRLEGRTDPASGNFTCSSDFDLSLDFDDVAHDEVAKVTGETTCVSAGQLVSVEVEGVIATSGDFTGTIAGRVLGISDTAPLLGTFAHGALDLSFSGLELSTGVAYSGTVTTRP